MLRFVTKNDYWAVEESGVAASIPPCNQWHMKSIQDAVCYDLIRAMRGKRILEVGGGHSRVLPLLAEHNECVNADEFLGDGNGPLGPAQQQGIRIVRTKLGEYSAELPDESFDLVFSISVVEHVPGDALGAFFDDCRRVLAPGAEMIHLIDAYVEHRGGDNADASARVTLLRRVFESGAFQPQGEPVIDADVAFETSYATNPDNMMSVWNRISPRLRPKRERAQGCSLIMRAIRC